MPIFEAIFPVSVIILSRTNNWYSVVFQTLMINQSCSIMPSGWWSGEGDEWQRALCKDFVITFGSSLKMLVKERDLLMGVWIESLFCRRGN